MSGHEKENIDEDVSILNLSIDYDQLDFSRGNASTINIPRLTLEGPTFTQDSCSTSYDVSFATPPRNSQEKTGFSTPPRDSQTGILKSSCLNTPQAINTPKHKGGKLLHSQANRSSFRVTFGRDLSPQLFDKRDPPNTPLKMGEQQKRPRPSPTKLAKFRKTPFRLSAKAEPEPKNPELLAPLDMMSTPSQKTVRFNRDLSPEVYDRNLPPNTPLKRGERIFGSVNTCIFVDPNFSPEKSTPSSSPTKSPKILKYNRSAPPMPELSFEFQENSLSIEPISSSDATANCTMQFINSKKSQGRSGKKRRSALYLFTNLLDETSTGPPALDISLTDKPCESDSPESREEDKEDIFSPDLHRNNILDKSTENLSKFFKEMFQEDVEIVKMDKITLRRSKRKRSIVRSPKKQKRDIPFSPYAAKGAGDMPSKGTSKSPAKKVIRYQLRSKSRPQTIVQVVPVLTDMVAEHMASSGSGDSSSSPTKEVIYPPPKAFRTVTFNRKVQSRSTAATTKTTSRTKNSADPPTRRSKRLAKRK